ncbi:MAG: glycosyltransferase family 2 protein [Bacteroidales bacterium]
MQIFNILFWVLLGIVVYAYVGYAIILALISFFVNSKPKAPQVTVNYQPEVTLVIAAYNECDLVEQKVKNGFAQTYPASKIQQLWITDGSTDGSERILKDFGSVKVLHSPQRHGKTAAINRAMPYVNTPITILTDANTMLSENAVECMVEIFSDTTVGCVAGEKRIKIKDRDNAVTSGEGIYWQYESLIKSLESKANSTLSAAGELYAIRTELFNPVPASIILDDFVISTQIAKAGHKVKYCPQAYAVEAASASIEEEKKRKIRIAAGAYQAMYLYPWLFNLFSYPLLSFQFISHKVLRWVLVPLAIIIAPMAALMAYVLTPQSMLNLVLAVISLAFVTLVGVGWVAREEKVGFKFIFLPYYLYVMNITMIRGFFRFIAGKQDVRWEKAKRVK